MLKYLVALLVLIILIGGSLYYLGYRMPKTPQPISPTNTDVAHTAEEFVTGLEVPWSIVWTSPTRMLVSERPGRIRIVENGRLLEKPLHVFPEVVSQAEEGLMSLAVHPGYARNKFVYAVYAHESERGLRDILIRFKDNNDSISDIVTILDGIPAAPYHAGSRLAFGPDGKLYITTGDATDRAIAQDIDNLGGKILRVNDDGSIPADNPFSNSPVWSYGHRNSQGISWLGNEMYATEHGPSGFDGPGGGDEVNRIVKGGNYGWPLVSHERRREGTIAPLALYTPAEAPASALVYTGDVFPQFKNNLFFGALRGEGVWRLLIDPSHRDVISGQEKLFTEYGRIRDIAQGPDGYIYFSTSNQDGRGTPAPSDDRIFRIIPKK